MLEKLLEGTASPKVKQRALFVLAQSNSPRAREVLRNFAKGSSTPELQSQAIQYLGVHGGPEAARGARRGLRRRPPTSTSSAGSCARSWSPARRIGCSRRRRASRTRSSAPKRSVSSATWARTKSCGSSIRRKRSVDVKRRIIRAMQNGGSVDRLIELAKTEQNPELRRDAVRALGVMRSARTGDVLVQIYASDTNVDVRKSVINALFIQENATALVALARKEQDITMKKEIVARLSHMRTKVATDYMIELLRQVRSQAMSRAFATLARAPLTTAAVSAGGGRWRSSRASPTAGSPRSRRRRCRRRSAPLSPRRPTSAGSATRVPVVDGERTMCCFNSGTHFVNGTDGRAGLLRHVPPRAVARTASHDDAADATAAAGRADQARRRRPDGRALPGRQQAGRAGAGVLGGLPARRRRPRGHLADRRQAGRQRRAAGIAGDGAAEHRPARSDHRRRDQRRSRCTRTPRPTPRWSGCSRPRSRRAVRAKVPFWLGNTRGRRGFEVLRRVIKDDPSQEVKKKAVFGISQSKEPRRWTS